MVKYDLVRSSCRDMADSLRHLYEYLRQQNDNVRVFFEFGQNHMKALQMGVMLLSSIPFQHIITQDEFHRQFILELIIRSSFCGYILAYRIIIAPKKKIKVLLC